MTYPILRGKSLLYVVAAIALTATVWTLAYRLIQMERDRNLSQGTQQATRLAEFFEQQALQLLRYSNAYVQAARREYLHHGGLEAVRQMMADIPLDHAIVSHITIIDETGRPLLVSGHPIKPGVTAQDREYFLALKASQGDPVFISRPHRGRNSGKLLLRLVRRINRPDGRFAGVIFAALEVDRITSFLTAMNLGPQSSATLVGTDKRIRARSSYGPLGPGQDISGSRLWQALEAHPVGVYRQTSIVDGVTRSYAYRRLPEFPLIAAIGVSLNDIAQASTQFERPVLAIATLTTLVIVITMLLIVRATIARQRVQAGETHLRTIVESVEEGIITIDERGRIESFNRGAQHLFGYHPEAIIGQNVAQLAAEPDQSHHDHYIHAYLSSGKRQIIGQGYREVRAQHRDGTVFPAELSIAEMHVGQRRLFIGVMRDLTERKRLEERLWQSQKLEAVGTLAGGIAHEFNNILAAILGFSDLALLEVSHTTATSQHLQAIRSAGLRAKALVEQILTFSRQSPPKRQAVSVPKVVQESLSLVRATLPATIALESRIVPDAGIVMADPIHLHQMLMNLCTNADYAMRQRGGRLRVSVDHIEADTGFAASCALPKPGAYVRLSVEDTGDGMSPEVVGRIFEPFYTTKGIGEGTGMGLAIVHGIVTSYGGAVTVASTPGAGSTFTIYLPRLTSAMEADVCKSAAPLPQGHGCILFVDDEVSLVQLGQQVLESLGYEVVASVSSVDALNRFRAEPERFDLVITDQTMPVMTGDRLAQALRYIRGDIPIVLCTGFSHVIKAEQAQALGIEAFCMKPLDMENLARIIERVLGRAEARNHSLSCEENGSTR